MVENKTGLIRLYARLYLFNTQIALVSKLYYPIGHLTIKHNIVGINAEEGIKNVK